MRDPGAATIPSGKKREVNVASIDHERCVGCGRCIAVCNQDAIHPDYDAAPEVLNCKIAEYTRMRQKLEDAGGLDEEHAGDKLYITHPDTDWQSCIEHAEKIGLGTSRYEIVRVK